MFLHSTIGVSHGIFVFKLSFVKPLKGEEKYIRKKNNDISIIEKSLDKTSTDLRFAKL